MARSLRQRGRPACTKVPGVTRGATPPDPSRQGALVLLALGALYLIWGSTYFAIRIAIVGFPPLLMAGSRFIVAGAVLYAVLRLRGAPRPSAGEWRAGASVGIFLCAANGLVSVAEQWVTSSMTAVLISTMPLSAVVVAGFWREWPTRGEVAGLLLGLAGVVVLQGGGDLGGEPLGALLIFASTVSWAIGSIWSRRLSLAKGLMASATEMLPGGMALLLFGLARGERLQALPGAQALAAWLYLAVFGSLIAFSAYNFLLRAVRPALATSYAYVNPAVAVIIGAVAGEPVGLRAVLALGLILAGVAVVAAVKQRPRT
jgi:drug/metabolite transporter (DMT)-like permease